MHICMMLPWRENWRVARRWRENHTNWDVNMAMYANGESHQDAACAADGVPTTQTRMLTWSHTPTPLKRHTHN